MEDIKFLWLLGLKLFVHDHDNYDTPSMLHSVGCDCSGSTHVACMQAVTYLLTYTWKKGIMGLLVGCVSDTRGVHPTGELSFIYI